MKIFVSAMGQVDNVGDTALRRAFLSALRPAGSLRVFVGSRDDSYIGNLGLQVTDRLYRSSVDWRRDLSRTLPREASLYAFNAGEMEVQRSYAMRYVRLAPLLLASRLRGGHAVHTGLGIRESSGWRLPIAATLRMCDIVSWRDTYSRRAMGLGRVAPDWAFDLGMPNQALLATEAPADRPILAVSVRYNGQRPDAAWVRSLRDLAATLGLSIVVVAQILRDGPLAEELAAELDGEALPWESPDHAAQEERLRSVYRRARLVVGDRLHAVVLGLTEGALPLVLSESPLADSPPAKATRALAAAGIVGVSVDRRLAKPHALERTALDVLSRRQPILRHVVEARATLGALADDIRRLT